MDLKSRLESHPVTHLRAAISKTNVKGYSKMKKAQVIELMLKNADRFNDIAMYIKPKKAASMTKEQLEAGAKKALSNTAAGKRMDAKKAEPKAKAAAPKAKKIKFKVKTTPTPKPVGKAAARLAKQNYDDLR